jgi:hypothetical protein
VEGVTFIFMKLGGGGRECFMKIKNGASNKKGWEPLIQYQVSFKAEQKCWFGNRIDMGGSGRGS